MTFDLERFRGTVLVPRQADVSVPDLSFFFPEGEPAIWTVRGLTGEEIARSSDSGNRQALITATIQAMANSAAAKSDRVEAMQNLLGYGSDVPEDLIKRFDHLTFCSVNPVIDRATAVKLFATYPLVAYTLSNKILELTGLGPDVGK